MKTMHVHTRGNYHRSTDCGSIQTGFLHAKIPANLALVKYKKNMFENMINLRVCTKHCSASDLVRLSIDNLDVMTTRC